jgi:putative FmdB family regulatory protein
MPIYEYQCTNCNAVSEQLRSISERALDTACPVCGAVAYRVMSSANLSRPAVGAKQAGSASHSHDQSLGSITNCTFENLSTGISLPQGARVTMKGNKFKNVKTPVEFRKK